MKCPGGQFVEQPDGLVSDDLVTSGLICYEGDRCRWVHRWLVESDDGAGVSLYQSVGRSLGDYLSAHDDRNPIGEVLSLIHVVGREHDCLPQCLEISNHLPGVPACGWIETRCGLIEEQEVRVACQANCNVETPLLASGKLHDPLVTLLLKTDDLDDLIHFSWVGVVTTVELDRFGDGEEAFDTGLLQNDPDPFLERSFVLAWVEPQHLNFAGVALAVTLEDLDGGGLSGPVRPKQSKDFALGNMEVDAFHGFEITVRLPQSLDLNSYIRHSGESKLFIMDTFIQPTPKVPDAWASDRILQETMRFYLGEEAYSKAEGLLAECGAWATDPATLKLALSTEFDPPRVTNYSAWGARIDEIRVSPGYLELGRAGVERGVVAQAYESEPFGEAARMVWAALVALWSPSSALYSCPIAMTDAAARTLMLYGDDTDREVADRLISRDPERAWTSGQWMTETGGGSDVGRTATVARLEDGVWKLYGTKWFTSATTSEMALTLARPEGAPEGSKGLALFRIHRTLEDGSPNAIQVRRLKEKLGTRPVPTAELELVGAVAHPVGPVDDGRGVARISTMLNITRLHNALASAAALGRGWAWATAFAEVREVFGRKLIDQPAHRATLADLAVDYQAALALSIKCAQLTGKVEHGTASDAEGALLRGLTPVMKLCTARWAVAGAAEAMEALGGVGYCEDSGMPTLVRNAHVLPIWEGTTNVLSLDLLRAAATSDSIEALLSDIERAVGVAGDAAELQETVAQVRTAVDAIRKRIEDRLGDLDLLQGAARSIAMGIGTTYACALLCEQGAWALHNGNDSTAKAATRLAQRGLVPPPPPDL